jgi:protein-S-isoprenylcysteine O-methyltransferase
VHVLRIVDIALFLAWMVVDRIVVFRRQGPGVRSWKDPSLLVIALTSWGGILLAVVLALARLGVPAQAWAVPAQVAGLVVLAGGIALRSAAIAQLGPLHTPRLAIQPGHRLVESGLYRRIRHPSYLGSAIAHLGFGLALGSWLSALAACGMSVAGYLHRMDVEERVLLEGLGDAYAAYRRRTHRLIPGVY